MTAERYMRFQRTQSRHTPSLASTGRCFGIIAWIKQLLRRD